MLNTNTYPSKQRVNRAFYFNPEGQLGTGTVPNETGEPELQRVPAPEEEPAAETETTPASTTH
jgi:hypothetical protein